MEKVFILGHGALQLEGVVKIPEGWRVVMYADAGESLLAPNGLAALSSDGMAGGREEFGRGTELDVMPNYTLKPFSDREIVRALASKVTTEGTLYIAGADIDAPGLGHFPSLRSPVSLVFLFNALNKVKGHIGPLDLHLVICRVVNREQKPAKQLEYRSTVAFGDEKRKYSDASKKPPLTADDDRRFARHAREVDEILKIAKRDPQAALMLLKKAPQHRAAEIASSVYPSLEKIWKRVCPVDEAAYADSAIAYFPNAIAGGKSLPADLLDASNDEEWRNAFYCYLNGNASADLKSISATNLYYRIASALWRNSTTDAEIAEIQTFVDDHGGVISLATYELNFLRYKQLYLSERNWDGLKDIGCEIGEDHRTEALEAVPNEIKASYQEILSQLYELGDLERHWTAFPTFFTEVIASHRRRLEKGIRDALRDEARDGIQQGAPPQNM
ncbi:putative adhesin [Streptomyces sp. NBC_01264]|uniref:putative adhesin n=1 Tax=Streptomyces sp. NBC_01264 TaxID=2903804 RepID=UPI0022528854|nr:hypothetical protein [Streptomyces sp. NBC_01264]MCX4784371.1 hypothetical protein [Streptomyces sp. NBC_01264]